MTEPIKYVTVRYRCPHCRRSYAAKANATKHVALCFADPARRTCGTCKHDEPASGGWDPATGLDDYEPRHCGEGLEQGPSCVECGEHPEACGHERYQPATRLRVLCPSWALRV